MCLAGMVQHNGGKNALLGPFLYVHRRRSAGMFISKVGNTFLISGGLYGMEISNAHRVVRYTRLRSFVLGMCVARRGEASVYRWVRADDTADFGVEAIN